MVDPAHRGHGIAGHLNRTLRANGHVSCALGMSRDGERHSLRNGYARVTSVPSYVCVHGSSRGSRWHDDARGSPPRSAGVRTFPVAIGERSELPRSRRSSGSMTAATSCVRTSPRTTASSLVGTRSRCSGDSTAHPTARAMAATTSRAEIGSWVIWSFARRRGEVCAPTPSWTTSPRRPTSRRSSHTCTRHQRRRRRRRAALHNPQSRSRISTPPGRVHARGARGAHIRSPCTSTTTRRCGPSSPMLSNGSLPAPTAISTREYRTRTILWFDLGQVLVTRASESVRNKCAPARCRRPRGELLSPRTGLTSSDARCAGGSRFAGPVGSWVLGT